jgi:hypothetical protein
LDFMPNFLQHLSNSIIHIEHSWIVELIVQFTLMFS